MSHSIRFLGIAVLAWAGVRAISLGLVPGTEALAFDLPARSIPPLAATQLPPIEPVAPGNYGSAQPMTPGYAPAYGGAAYAPSPYPPTYAYPIYLPMPASYPRQSAPAPRNRYPVAEPVETNPYFDPVKPVDQWPGEQLSLAAPITGHQTTPSFEKPGRPDRFDRLQLSTWAVLRSRPGAPGLGTNGQLGGSQAGARLLWRFDPRLAISLRTTAPVNSQRGGEVALGARYQPFTSIPVAITAERRQATGRFGGRTGFSIFADGGVYGRPAPLRTTLDAYLQTGVVGVRSRDWFVDGSAAVSRPIWRNFSAGLGVWGAAQPGLARLDAGPRLSMRVRTRMRVHVDYRQKLAGNAEPGSGGVVTLAGDF